MRIKIFFQKIIIVFTSLFIGYILYYALFTLNKRATFMNSYVENEFLLHLIGGSLIAMGVMWAFCKINKMSNRTIKIFIAIAIGVLLTGEIIIGYNFQVTPTTDSYMICEQALLLAKGQVEQIGQGLDSVYFTVYTNNNFLVILLSYFFKALLAFGVEDIIIPLTILNSVFINLSIWLSFLFVKEIAGIRNACKVLLLFVFSPVFYVSLPWSYSVTYSLPFQVGLLYLAIKIAKEKRSLYLVMRIVLLGFFSVIGFNIRPTTIIPLIAIIICAIINKISKKEILKKDVCIVAIFLLSVILIHTACKGVVNKYYDADSNTRAYPITHWIMTGLHEDGTVSAEYNNFTQSFETTDEMRAANIKEIRATLSEYGVSGTVNHIGRKLRISWIDGSYNASVRMHPNRVYSPLSKYLVGEKKDLFLYYSQSFYIAILLFVLVSLLIQKKQKCNEYLFPIDLTIFGAIVFYIIWEGKESFSLPFLPLLYILAVNGATSLLGDLKDNRIMKYVLNKSFYLVLGVIALTITTMIAQYSLYTNERIKRYDRSVECSNSDYLRYIDEVNKLTQQFYTSIPFDTLEIQCQADEETSDNRYLIELSDKEKVYFAKEVSAQDINNSGRIKLEFDKINPEGYNQYTITIRNLGDTDSIQWGYLTAAEVDNYKGTCVFDNIEQTHDLYIQVYHSYETTYSTPLKYIVSCVGILLMEILVLYFTQNLKSIICETDKK